MRPGAASLALAAALAGTAGAPRLAAAAALPSPGLALHACRLGGLSQDAMCGTLERPLDPARPDGVRISLHVAVLPAVARHKLADPVFFFAGGPGQSAIRLAGTVAAWLGRLGERRDVVLIDQRGTGHSAPLQCDAPSPEEALERSLDRSRLVAAMDACRLALQKLPWGDLRFYTTSLAMADADAVRQALGADQVDLVGVSYGTRAALDYLRLYPAHVRRAVLDGVAPPDMVLPASFDIDGQAALDHLFDDCTRDPACASTYPGLRDTWQRLLRALPRAVEVDDPVTGRALHATLTSDAVRGLVHPALYTPALGALLPLAIAQAADGRFGPLLALASAPGGAAPSDLSDGEHFSVVCSEDVPRLPTTRAEGAASAGGSSLYRDVCAHWPRADVPAGFYTIPRSPVPVLLLSGGLDPVTPPAHAEHTARALGPLARTIVVAGGGHGVGALPCMRDVVYHFVDAPDDVTALAADGRCAARIPRPPAFRPVLPARAASAANDPHSFDDDGTRRPAAEAPP